ncbi:PKD domain-containing protein [Flavobacterium gelidilacus]|uniref:PKD domain-containing protein n=1 Tax=Flavobacterium gelidilacus TaxID=206041 RepID=UPI00146DB58E|nr:PKD domain-containing protein [Flavobacterium gelidilacus]
MAFKNSEKEECNIEDFNIEGIALEEGELLTFSDNSDNSYSWRWYFGDGSDISYKSKVVHVFKKHGIYKVKLLINNSCVIEKNIKILPKNIVVEKKLDIDFFVPSKVYLGQKIKFSDKTENGTTWEWRFGETDVIDSKVKNPSYVYKTTGVKTVSIVVNGNKKNVKFKDVVVVMPEVKKTVRKVKTNTKVENVPEVIVEILETPEVEVIKAINEVELTELIYIISDGKLSYESFKNNFCADKLPLIQVNDASKYITLREFYDSVVDKKIKIKEVKINKEKNKCIVLILVYYKLKTFF